MSTTALRTGANKSSGYVSLNPPRLALKSASGTPRQSQHRPRNPWYEHKVRYLQPYKVRNKPADLTIHTNRRLFDDSASDAPTALATASASCCSPLPIDTTISRQTKASSSSAFFSILSSRHQKQTQKSKLLLLLLLLRRRVLSFPLHKQTNQA
jgi:hypothetical protein